MGLFLHYLKIVTEAFALSTNAYRSWYNPVTSTFIRITKPMDTHAAYVFDHPDEFGLTPDELAGATPRDRDRNTFVAAFSKGWIRIAGETRRDPTAGMIFEGSDLKALVRVMRMFFTDQSGQLQRAAIKVWSETGGKEYFFQDAEAMRRAFRGDFTLAKVFDIPDNPGEDD